MSSRMGWHRLLDSSCARSSLSNWCNPDPRQNATLWPTGSTEDSEKMVSLVSARRGGAVSTATVSVLVAPMDTHRIVSSLGAVCQTDDACVGFPLRGQPTGDDDRVGNMTCYKGGETVFNNHQFCDVTSAFPSLPFPGKRS